MTTDTTPKRPNLVQLPEHLPDPAYTAMMQLRTLMDCADALSRIAATSGARTVTPATTTPTTTAPPMSNDSRLI
jgi:hypothetical protein